LDFDSPPASGSPPQGPTPERSPPPLPEDRPARFRATVHGTVFADRPASLERLEKGDGLTLIPDPPMEEAPRVWVHLATGEPVGYLPTEIGDWLAPWLLRGGGARARVLRVSGPDTPSWRRLLVEVACAEP